MRILYNGPERFTPDGQFLLGEGPGLPHCFVAAGFNSMGIASTGGAGWALAHWIADGRPPFDLWSVDVRLFGPAHANVAYRRDQVVESVGPALRHAVAGPRARGRLPAPAFSPVLGRVVALASVAPPPDVVLDDALMFGGRYEVLAGDRTVAADLHRGPVAADAGAVRP